MNTEKLFTSIHSLYEAKKKAQAKVLGAVALKHRKVLENLGKAREDGKKPTMEQGMIDAGYSPSYARAGQIKDTRAWNELLEVELPDNELTRHHNQLLNLSKIEHMVFPVAATQEQITQLIEECGCHAKRFMFSETQTHVWFFAPDGIAKKNALNMAYKLKKRYDNSITIKGKLSGLSDEEIRRRKSEIIAGVIGAIAGRGKKKDV
ncbi:MAG: hypothetical protein AAB588_05790 [Patescibacteria group bacterium]